MPFDGFGASLRIAEFALCLAKFTAFRFRGARRLALLGRVGVPLVRPLLTPRRGVGQIRDASLAGLQIPLEFGTLSARNGVEARALGGGIVRLSFGSRRGSERFGELFLAGFDFPRAEGL